MALPHPPSNHHPLKVYNPNSQQLEVYDAPPQQSFGTPYEYLLDVGSPREIPHLLPLFSDLDINSDIELRAPLLSSDLEEVLRRTPPTDFEPNCTSTPQAKDSLENPTSVSGNSFLPTCLPNGDVDLRTMEFTEL